MRRAQIRSSWRRPFITDGEGRVTANVASCQMCSDNRVHFSTFRSAGVLRGIQNTPRDPTVTPRFALPSNAIAALTPRLFSKEPAVRSVPFQPLSTPTSYLCTTESFTFARHSHVESSMLFLQSSEAAQSGFLKIEWVQTHNSLMEWH